LCSHIYFNTKLGRFRNSEKLKFNFKRAFLVN
jgi:hypothetical protein